MQGFVPFFEGQNIFTIKKKILTLKQKFLTLKKNVVTKIIICSSKKNKIQFLTLFY